MHPTDQTIVAISSPAGSAARAIVRLSGPGAAALADGVFAGADGRPLANVPPFRAVDGVVRPADGIELPARAYVFHSPRSYTRQDLVELHVPGSSAAAAALAGRLVELGAVEAAAGEFTARAFFAGRIDLSAAQAVADVINADDDAQLRAAMGALGGRTHRLCAAAAEQLTEVLATVEASIDLADEDIHLAAADELAQALAAVAGDLRRTAEGAGDVPDSARHVHVVLAGRTNVGKSSLVNALTGADRAIVSAMAGTTRDVLSASLTLDGTAVLLQDAAGFAAAADALAVAADSAARQAVARADVICFVVEAATPAADRSADAALLGEVRAANPNAPLVLLANKIDLAPDAPHALRAVADDLQLAPIAASATTGAGIDAVRAALSQRLQLSAGRSGGALGLHRRQKRCLLAAADAAAQAAGRLAQSAEIVDAAEWVAIDLRAALAELGQISGEVVTEDVLGRIFARFCVGK